VTDLIGKTVRNLRRRKTEPTLTPEGVIRWLRAYYAEGYRSSSSFADRPDLRLESLRVRRDIRRRQNEMLAKPAFRRIVLACEGMDLEQMFRTLTDIAARVGLIQSTLHHYSVEPSHPATWGSKIPDLRADASRLRSVAQNYPLMSDTLTGYADQLEKAAAGAPTDHWYPFDKQNIGTRGKAAQDADSALRGWFVVELFNRLPDGVEQPYATVAELLRHAGLDIEPHHVRTIIANRRMLAR
jgi:hypothetical protein